MSAFDIRRDIRSDGSPFDGAVAVSAPSIVDTQKGGSSGSRSIRMPILSNWSLCQIAPEIIIIPLTWLRAKERSSPFAALKED